MKTMIIYGSSRRPGNTQDLIKLIRQDNEYEFYDLADYNIAPYSYTYDYASKDRFLDIAKRMTHIENIIFATPVYWYAMSAHMKIFFDRLTDLITVHKNLGRALKGKNTYLVVNGFGPKIPEGFYVPFQETSKYFDMEFKGSIYYSNSASRLDDPQVLAQVKRFQEAVQHGKSIHF